MIEEAWELYRLGHREDAADRARRLLQRDPHQAQALYLLGRLASDAGNHAEAVDWFERSTQSAARVPETWHNLGLAYAAQGRHGQARECLEHALRLNPQLLEVRHNLGAIYQAEGRVEEAFDTFRQALEIDPGFLPAALNLSTLHRERGELGPAEQVLRQALARGRETADLHYHLALVLEAQGRFAEQAEALRQALRMAPEYVQAQNNLGVALARQGQLEAALAAFEQALAWKPDHESSQQNLVQALKSLGRAPRAAEMVAAFREPAVVARAWHRRGTALQAGGRAGAAVEAFRAALALAPERAEYWNDLGNALQEAGNQAGAIEAYQRGLERDPRLTAALCNLAFLRSGQGLVDESDRLYRRSLAIRPDARVRLLVATQLPTIYQTAEEIPRRRARLVEEVEQLHADGITLDPTKENAPTLFLLAYQGQNDRDVHRRVAELYRPGQPLVEPAPRPRSGRRRWRVGLCSKHFRNHTIGELNRGLIAQLPRDEIELTVFSVTPGDDATARAIQAGAEHYVVLPNELAQARRHLAEAQLDLLFYPDLGMDPLTYTLAMTRVAPRQALTWGHPVTTGFRSLDYFVSSRWLEVPEADQHYHERLVRLDSLGPFYERPALSGAARTRADFGLPDEAHLYGCLQTLFKFHPDFDAILAEILRRDPRGLVLLVEGRHPSWTEQLVSRFRRVMPDVAERIRVLRQQPKPDYLALTGLCEVTLDPLHFGGGNTSYEALALGVPVVTWPSHLLRARITQAMYARLDYRELVVDNAADYVERAVRLATEPDYRAEVRREILARVGELFRDPQAVADYHAFFLRALEEGPQGTTA